MYCGTPHYSAPEIFLKGKITPKIDIWAFGVIIFEIISETSPFRDLDLMTIKNLIINNKGFSFNLIPSNYRSIV